SYMSVGPGPCGCQWPRKHVVISARKQPVHPVVPKTLRVLRVRMIEGREPALRDKHHRLEFRIVHHGKIGRRWQRWVKFCRIDTLPTLAACPLRFDCDQFTCAAANGARCQDRT